WAGKRVFASIGCSHCHWDTFRTGDSPVAGLNRQTFHPYSDFLLHDMGSLGDGIETGDARGREFRTAPLWGVSAVTKYLHDGRAATVKDAILAHDGQARRARDRFARASADDQAALLAFLQTL
ncbi:MAG TPA: di-heme oxidoredictase family protein, partial [Myxococcaceae bacterium]|nr:di-heme oxidoredictase family protein [Myxococcaceae bacterium]